MAIRVRRRCRRDRRCRPARARASMLLDLAGAEHADRDAADLTLRGRHAHERHGDVAIRREPAFALHDERELGRRPDRAAARVNSPPFTSQSATVAPLTWLTTRPAGSASETSRARPCCTSTRTTDEIVETSSPRPIDDATRARKRSGIFGAAIVGLALPRERQRLIGAAEHRPAAFRGGFRSLADESAGDRQSTPPLGNDSVARDTGAADDGSVIDSVPAADGDRQRDLERQHRSSRAREHDVRRRSFDQRQRLSVEARIAHPEAGRNRHFHPAFAQAHRRSATRARRWCRRLPRAKSRVGTQLVVDPGQRRIDRRRRWRGGSGFARARSARYSSTGSTTQPSRRCLRASVDGGAQAHEYCDHDTSCSRHRGLSFL